MNKKIIFLIPAIILLGVVLIYFIFYSDPPPPQGGLYNYNIVVLLDLSDRLQQPSQVHRDNTIIKELVSLFEEQVKNKLYIHSKDTIQIAIAPQPVGYNSSILKVSDNLKINMGEQRIAEKRKVLPTLKTNLLSSVASIYEEARKNPLFIGADIWGFFKNDLESFLRPSSENNTKNIVVVLTDGYIEFERQAMGSRQTQGRRANFMSVRWFLERPSEFNKFDEKDYGLIPVRLREEFQKNTSIFVCEISPRDILNNREFEIIQKYWDKWLTEMGIQKHRLQKQPDSIAQVINVLREFAFPKAKTHLTSSVSPESPPAKAHEISKTADQTTDPLETAPVSTPSPSPTIDIVEASVQFVYKIEDGPEQPMPEGTSATFQRIQLNSRNQEIKTWNIASAILDDQGIATFNAVPCGKPFKVLLAPGSIGHVPKAISRPREYPNKSDPLQCKEKVFIGKYTLHLWSPPST